MKSPICICSGGHGRRPGRRCACGDGSHACACARPPRPRQLPRVKARDGRVHKGAVYRPQFAIGIMCRDEADQRALYGDLAARLAGREIKVLVI